MTPQSDSAGEPESDKPVEQPSDEPATEPDLPMMWTQMATRKRPEIATIGIQLSIRVPPRFWNVDDDCNGWVDQDGTHQGNATINTVGFYQGQAYSFSDSCEARSNGWMDLQM